MTKKAQDIANEAAKMAAEMAYAYTMHKLAQEMSYPAPDPRSLAGMAREAGARNIEQVLAYVSRGEQAPPDLKAMVEQGGVGGNEVQKMRDYINANTDDPARNDATWKALAGYLQQAGIFSGVTTAAKKQSDLTKVAHKLVARNAPKSSLMKVAEKLQKHLK